LSKKDDSATKHALELIGLAHDEVSTYYKLTGRGPVMIGEIALLADVSEERAEEIANNLFHKGLLKQIPGKTPIYETLPPYAALISQLQKFHKYISDIKSHIPAQLSKTFAKLESESGKVEVAKMFGIYRGDETYQHNNIRIFPVKTFFQKLHQGKVF